MKDITIQTQIEKYRAALDEIIEDMESYEEKPSNKLFDRIFSLSKTSLERVWEEAEQAGRAKGMEDTNEDWYSHYAKGFSIKEIYKAIKENIISLKQTT